MKRILFAVATALLISAGPVLSATLSDEQKNEIEQIVRSYLLEHPEILREMSNKLQEQEQAAEDTARGAALTQNAAAVYKTEGDPVVGNPNGDVTLVEFFDYNCAWCKRSVGEIVALAEQDKNLKIIMKEFPIFGENSEYAAKAAMASDRQGKYWPYHQALFSHNGPVTPEVADQLAEDVGLDVAKLKADMNDPKITERLAANHQLAQSLLINGTPAFVIDDQIVPGYMPLDGLTAAVAQVRDGGGCKLC